MEIISTHKNTDFDALASTIAATILYKDAIIILPKSINPNVRAFLSIHKDIYNFYNPDDINPDKVDRLIIVDVNNWERLEKMDAFKQKTNLEIILWDHHAIKGNIIPTEEHNEEMGANITLMVKEIMKRGKSLNPIQATVFLIGLYEDTGNLTFISTKPEDAHVAAFLLEQKADLSILNTFLQPAYGEKQKEMLFEMLQSATRIRINGLTISINKIKMPGHVVGLAVVVNMFRKILNVDAVFGIFVENNKKKCIVIGRSNPENINVGAIMKSLGGGGHPGAGSAMLKSVSPETIEKMIITMIKGNQFTSVQVHDLMSFPVDTLPSDISMKQAEIILRKNGYTGMPVVNSGKLVGIISIRDFKKIRKKSQRKAPVKAFMSSNVHVIEPDKNPIQAAHIMVKYDVGRLPVIDEKGKLIGIITRSDSMNYFYDLLPD